MTRSGRRGARLEPRILVLHGPNLNLLGTREPELYGRRTLAEIDALLQGRARAAGAELSALQSNHEGVLIDRLHQARGQTGFVLLNGAGLTHTSVALRDAVVASEIPTIEVHLSNVHRREAFRQTSLLSGVCVGIVSGFGALSYVLALEAALDGLGLRR